MREYITYVGLDTHKKSHQACVLYPGQDPREFSIGNTPQDIKRMATRLKKEAPGEIRVCYEAGPCGFSVQRQIQAQGIACEVIAPSLVPRKPGERVKTDRKDARQLAEYYKQGLLTPVQPPTSAQEAARSLCRCREAAQETLGRARHQLLKFLLCQARYYSEGGHWTQKHFRWLRGQRFEEEVAAWVFQEYLSEVERCQERVQRLDREIERLAQTDPYREPVGWLRCLRGLDTLTALCVLCELYAFERFRSPRELMSFLGFTPSENSSGERTSKGPITKAGNRRVRRLLIEVAWHQSNPVRVGQALKKRREGQPEWAIQQANKAMQRFHSRYRHLTQRGKKPQVAVTAVAREVAGFIWGVLYGHPQPENPGG